jgi:hypothetical protein
MDDFIIEMFESEFPDWEYVDSSVIVCPCGDEIEHDGRCPQGCVSPLLQLGFI